MMLPASVSASITRMPGPRTANQRQRAARKPPAIGAAPASATPRIEVGARALSPLAGVSSDSLMTGAGSRLLFANDYQYQLARAENQRVVSATARRRAKLRATTEVPYHIKTCLYHY